MYTNLAQHWELFLR